MKILILGAAGRIPNFLCPLLLERPDNSLVLYARNGAKRITLIDSEREKIVEGNFNDSDALTRAMSGVDAVYLNAMGDIAAAVNIVQVMHQAGVKRIIGATILGVYDEVPGPFGKWNRNMVGMARIRQQKESAELFEQSDLDYTLLRLTWLYDQDGNDRYMLTGKGQPFVGAQVTRQAVARLITEILHDQSNRFMRQSLGVSEPDTDWNKPSFYS